MKFLLSILFFLTLASTAFATEFYASEKAARAAHPGGRASWICTGKDKLWYIGRGLHCGSHRTERQVMRSEGRLGRYAQRSTTSKAVESRPVSATPAAPVQTASVIWIMAEGFPDARSDADLERRLTLKGMEFIHAHQIEYAKLRLKHDFLRMAEERRAGSVK
jgi:hypothetical protein